ncbi:MAG: hypothetical protein R6V85_03715, partial [Polyangia bacterium]
MQHTKRLDDLSQEFQQALLDESVPMTKERLEGALTEDLKDKIEFVQSIEDYKAYMKKYRDEITPMTKHIG